MESRLEPPPLLSPSKTPAAPSAPLAIDFGEEESLSSTTSTVVAAGVCRRADSGRPVPSGVHRNKTPPPPATTTSDTCGLHLTHECVENQGTSGGQLTTAFLLEQVLQAVPKSSNKVVLGVLGSAPPLRYSLMRSNELHLADDKERHIGSVPIPRVQELLDIGYTDGPLRGAPPVARPEDPFPTMRYTRYLLVTIPVEEKAAPHSTRKYGYNLLGPPSSARDNTLTIDAYNALCDWSERVYGGLPIKVLHPVFNAGETLKRVDSLEKQQKAEDDAWSCDCCSCKEAATEEKKKSPPLEPTFRNDDQKYYRRTRFALELWINPGGRHPASIDGSSIPHHSEATKDDDQEAAGETNTNQRSSHHSNENAVLPHHVPKFLYDTVSISSVCAKYPCGTFRESGQVFGGFNFNHLFQHVLESGMSGLFCQADDLQGAVLYKGCSYLKKTHNAIFSTDHNRLGFAKWVLSTDFSEDRLWDPRDPSDYLLTPKFLDLVFGSSGSCNILPKFIDISRCPRLRHFEPFACHDFTNLTELHLGYHPHVKSLSYGFMARSGIETIDLSGLVSLRSIDSLCFFRCKKLRSINFSEDSVCHLNGVYGFLELNEADYGKVTTVEIYGLRPLAHTASEATIKTCERARKLITEGVGDALMKKRRIHFTSQCYEAMVKKQKDEEKSSAACRFAELTKSTEASVKMEVAWTDNNSARPLHKKGAPKNLQHQQPLRSAGGRNYGMKDRNSHGHAARSAPREEKGLGLMGRGGE